MSIGCLFIKNRIHKPSNVLSSSPSQDRMERKPELPLELFWQNLLKIKSKSN